MHISHRRRKALRGIGGLAAGTGAVNLLAGLSWQAGASTTLTVGSGRARATATNAPTDNPRIFKGPFQVTAGVTYRRQGNVYMGTTASMFVRTSTSSALSSGDIQNTNVFTQTFINDTFTPASYTGPAYFGIVPVTSVNGDYGEVDDGFSITVVG